MKTMRALFRGKITELKATRAKEIIGPARYAAVLAIDSHPCWVTWTIAEAGISTGDTSVEGVHQEADKRWTEAAVDDVIARVNEAATNPFCAPSIFLADDVLGHDGSRQSRGKLMAAWKEGKRADGMGYVGDPAVAASIKSGELDTDSIEAQVWGGVVDDGYFEVEKVFEVSGLLVANSRKTPPGFASAGVRAIIQETERDHEMKLSEVKAAIIENGWKPEQIFGKEDILAVGFVKQAVDEEVAEKVEETKKEVEAAKGEVAKKDEAIKAMQADTAKLRVQTRRTDPEIVKIVEGHAATKDKGKLLIPYIMDNLPEAVLAEADPAKLKAAIEAATPEIVTRGERLGLNFFPVAGGNTSDGGTGGQRNNAPVTTMADASDPEKNPNIPKE